MRYTLTVHIMIDAPDLSRAEECAGDIECAILDLNEDAVTADVVSVRSDVLTPADPEACAGCGCMPGDGKTPGCTDPEGCGYDEN